MHPKVQRRIFDIVAESGMRPGRVLEVGGRTNQNSLLRAPGLAGAERIALNLVKMTDQDGITGIVGNGNDMSGLFEDEAFDMVLCNAMLEHDRYFWRSLAEMKRVLRAGGLLVIGVPGYVEDPERDHGKSTHTYKVHYKVDYYRFSEQAVREVFFEGMRAVEVDPIMAPPRIIGSGYKPRGFLPEDGFAPATVATKRASG